MLIECLVKRAEPIVVPISNEKYAFEPDGKGRVVAEVWIESHIEAFLAVSHLYRKAEDAEAIVVCEVTAPPPPITNNNDRLDVIAALKQRDIAFKVTETTSALRAKLAAAAQPVTGA